MKPILVTFAASLALAGCTTQTPPEDLPAMPDAMCAADPAQSLMGRKADANAGAELLKLTGAKTLRWVPPRSAVTMDYRADRLTVSYDDDYTIVRISCG